MNISINHDWEDAGTARAIATLCETLHIDHALEGRRDWLLHGLRQLPDEVTHAIFVLSPRTEGTWWVPFQQGLLRQRGISVLLFSEDGDPKVPGFLQGAPLLRGVDDLRDRLIELQLAEGQP